MSNETNTDDLGGLAGQPFPSEPVAVTPATPVTPVTPATPVATTAPDSTVSSDAKAEAKAAKKAARSQKRAERRAANEEAAGQPRPPRRNRPSVDIAKVRSLVGQLIWAVAVLAALVMALAALLLAVKANGDNDAVKDLVHAAEHIDLGIFDRKNGIYHFTGHNAGVKNALVNYGVAAVAYLIVGRIVSAVVKP